MPPMVILGQNKYNNSFSFNFQNVFFFNFWNFENFKWALQVLKFDLAGCNFQHILLRSFRNYCDPTIGRFTKKAKFGPLYHGTSPLVESNFEDLNLHFCSFEIRHSQKSLPHDWFYIFSYNLTLDPL